MTPMRVQLLQQDIANEAATIASYRAGSMFTEDYTAELGRVLRESGALNAVNEYQVEEAAFYLGCTAQQARNNHYFGGF